MPKRTIRSLILGLAVAATLPLAFAAAPAPFTAQPFRTGPVKVGPPKGTLFVVGGGAMGADMWKAFIDAAGGPDALILDVPNNSIDHPAKVAPDWAGKGLRDHGARNVHVLFTQSREVANSDAFTAIIKKAGGIWLDGGRQYLDVQAYGGTKTEQAFREVLQRGGVIGGSSAGAAVQGDFMVRGAPSHNNYIMDYPGSDKGFGYLRDVAVDIHVVVRERLPDLTEITARYPNVLGISADEGTAWIVHGDKARIMGRGQAFVYNGNDPTDPGRPFLTLHPGDQYNLYTRRIISRAAAESPVKAPLITALFKKYDAPATGGATVLVAENGNVFVDRAFGIPPQERYMPRTALPQFPLGDITKVFSALCAHLSPKAASGRGPERPRFFASPLERCISRVSRPVGMYRTTAPGGHMAYSDVDELYRFALGLEDPATWPGADYAAGWTLDTAHGVKEFAAYGTRDGKRAALVRVPSRHATVIILTNDPSADARAMAGRILGELLR